MDTDQRAACHQIEAQRRLGGTGRFLTACRMSETLRRLASDRIRRAHPGLDERGVQDRLLLELYGHTREP